MPKLKSALKRPMLLFYVCVFLIMFVFTSLTPMVADDYSYCFAWGDNSRVHSIGQIIRSMTIHRELTNGRVIVHGLVQFLLMLPKPVFNFLNALNACLIFYLFSCFYSAEKAWTRVFLALCSFMTVFCFTPSFGQVFLWLDGSVNYSWVLSAALLFLLPYARAYLGGELPPLWHRLLLFTLGFVLGCSSESCSVAVGFTAALLWLLRGLDRKNLSPAMLLPLLGVALGFVFLMSAPATSGRAMSNGLSSLVANVVNVLSLAKERFLPVYMIYAAAFALSCLAGVDKKRLVLSAVLFLCGVLSLATYCMALYFIGRHMFFAMSITVAAMMVLFGELLKKGRTVPPTVYAACMAVLFLFNFCLGAVDICVLYSHSLRREAYIESALENGEKDLVFEIHSPRTEYAASAGLLDLSEDPEGWPNYSIALYYGLDSITGYYP